MAGISRWTRGDFRKALSRAREKAEGLHEQKELFLPGLGFRAYPPPRQTVTRPRRPALLAFRVFPARLARGC